MELWNVLIDTPEWKQNINDDLPYEWIHGKVRKTDHSGKIAGNIYTLLINRKI